MSLSPPFLCRSICLIFVSSAIVCNAWANEGIIENLSLSGPKDLEALNIIYESKVKLQTESDNAERASFVRRLSGAVVGKDRLLFEVEFDHPPVLERSSFCLYLDVDNDSTTGRQEEDVKGVDLMVALESSANKASYLQFKNPSFNGDNCKVRAGWVGSKLYITVEMPLPDHPSSMRAFFLSSKDGGASNFRTETDAMLELSPSAESTLPL